MIIFDMINNMLILTIDAMSLICNINKINLIQLNNIINLLNLIKLK